MCVGNSTGLDPQEWLLMVKIRLNSGCSNPISIRKRLDTNWQAHWVTSYVIGCYVFLNTIKNILLKGSLCPLSAQYFLELRSHGNQTHEIIQDLKKTNPFAHSSSCYHYNRSETVRSLLYDSNLVMWRSGLWWYSVKKWQLLMLECSIGNHLLSCVLRKLVNMNCFLRLFSLELCLNVNKMIRNS